MTLEQLRKKTLAKRLIEKIDYCIECTDQKDIDLTSINSRYYLKKNNKSIISFSNLKELGEYLGVGYSSASLYVSKPPKHFTDAGFKIEKY